MDKDNLDNAKVDLGELREQILRLTREYSKAVHNNFRPAYDHNRSVWTPGESIPYAGRVFGSEEVEAAVGSTLDFWLTLGKNGAEFEKELEEYLGVKKSLLVNSGSSANLVALASLFSLKIESNKRINPGDEVITVAAGFPTTVAPIIQLGAIPVFIDADPVTGNPKTEHLESAYRPGVTKAVIFAHSLGNPFNLLETLKFCKAHDIWLIEDNCDALGSTYSMPKDDAEYLGFSEGSPGLLQEDGLITRYTGTWGDISTQSFYPPHHMTMGEGGAVNIVRDRKLMKYAESVRDWGRDCWCPSGTDNTCNKRYSWQLGDLPSGYDHKYTYSHLGFNLKPLDYQAAIGREQLKRLSRFTESRKNNWNRKRQKLDILNELFTFTLPTHAKGWNTDGTFSWDQTGCKTSPSWFGFKIGIKEGVNFSRKELTDFLELKKIGNRMLFGGNLVRQPVFKDLKRERENSFRVVGGLEGSDEIMHHDLFLGTYPGLTEEMINYECEQIIEFCLGNDN